MTDSRGIGDDQLITVAEAAVLRGVSKAAIHDLVKRGRLTFVTRYGRVLVLRDEIANFNPERPGRKRKAADENKDTSDEHRRSGKRQQREQDGDEDR